MYDDGNSTSSGDVPEFHSQSLQGNAMRPTAPEIGPSVDPRPTPPSIFADPHSPRVWAVAEPSAPDLETVPGVSAYAREPDYRALIAKQCDDLKAFLLAKNKAYGNSAFEPSGVFSKLSAREGLLIRIDDKIKRIRNGNAYPGDDDVKDLTGYLILLMVIDNV